MKSGSLYTKAWWIIIHEGPRKLLRRVVQYIAKRHWRDYFPGINEEWAYCLWLKKEQLRIKEKLVAAPDDMKVMAYKPLISIIIPLVAIETDYLEETLKSILKQAYPFWELCAAADCTALKPIEVYKKYQNIDGRFKLEIVSSNRSVVQSVNYSLSICTGDFIEFLDCGDELAPHALLELAKVFNNDPSVDIIYSDEDHLSSSNKRTKPLFKPGWSPDLLLSMNYIGRCLTVRKGLLDELGGLREDAEGIHYYDLLLRLSELTKKVVRLPEVLYHKRGIPDWILFKSSDEKLRRKGQDLILNILAGREIEADVDLTGEGHFRVRYHLQKKPLVSIIIPTRDKVELLERCINSILAKTTYKNYEIIIVNNRSVEAETEIYLDKLKETGRFIILNYNEQFNFSKINNFAVEHANGCYLLFLNNDTEVIAAEWLEEMMSIAQQKEVGAVGAKLLFSDGTIQHGGIILGLRGIAGHAFYNSPADYTGYMDFSMVCRNCSAVTAACMLIRRNIFQAVGGFDCNLDVDLNDVDLCLRVIEKGYNIIWIPYVLFYHHESRTRGHALSESNIKYFLTKWKKVVAEGDLFYDPNLSISSDYRIKI